MRPCHAVHDRRDYYHSASGGSRSNGGLISGGNVNILAFLSALAEDERERITRRASDGRAAAKAHGVKFGPKSKLTEHQKAVARRRLAEGDSCRSIAKDIGVAHTTIVRRK